MYTFIYKVATGTLMLSLAACQSTEPHQFIQRNIYKESVTSHAPFKNEAMQQNKQVLTFKQQETPSKPYRILGEASVARTNFFGMTRKPQEIETSLKKLASSIGGDAIMNIKSEPNETHAEIIVFEKLIF